jgi:N-terminal domain of toast_rack, DUF2154
MLIGSKFLAPARAASGLCALAASSILLISCGPDFGPPGPERTETRSIPLDQTEEVRVDLRMGAGELRVHGGSDNLMDGRFTYNRLRLRPEISYSSGGFRGHLDVEEPGHVGGSTRRYEWDLSFNDHKPLDIDVKCGAGESHLDLEDLTLRRVNIEMGVGELKMDLRGQPKQDYSVRIHGGIGEATVYLPQNAGIEADVKGGIGDVQASGLQKRDGRYVNDAYGRANATIHLDIEGGIGTIHLIAD